MIIFRDGRVLKAKESVLMLLISQESLQCQIQTTIYRGMFVGRSIEIVMSLWRFGYCEIMKLQQYATYLPKRGRNQRRRKFKFQDDGSEASIISRVKQIIMNGIHVIINRTGCQLTYDVKIETQFLPGINQSINQSIASPRSLKQETR